MAQPRVKSLAKLDEVMTFPLLTARVVDLGDITVGHFVYDVGWSWEEHMRPLVRASGDRLGTSEWSFRAGSTPRGLDGAWRLSRFVTS